MGRNYWDLLREYRQLLIEEPDNLVLKEISLNKQANRDTVMKSTSINKIEDKIEALRRVDEIEDSEKKTTKKNDQTNKSNCGQFLKKN